MHSFKQLQCFVAIVEEGGFTPAAQKLYMTQPAISWQIKTLEGDMGLKLIERSERKLVLTEAGRLFYESAKTILNQYEKMDCEMEQFKNMEKGSLRIGASTIPGEYLLSDKLARFTRMFPQAELRMQIGDSSSIIKMLLQENISVGIVGLQPQEEQIVAKPFQTDEIVCIAPIGHPLCEKEQVLLEDVLPERILMREFGSGTRNQLQQEIKKRKNVNCKVLMELGSTRAILSAVEAGLGLSWVSRMAVRGEKVKILTIEDFRIERELYIIWLKNRTLSPLGQTFVEMLEEGHD
ncbi:LysR family transcriptional regulator [Clostridia bacterium]|nr:LysR family transcriptional regulator [Clostridia bacterium]